MPERVPAIPLRSTIFLTPVINRLFLKGVSVYRVGDSYHGQWVLEARPESAEK